jgi:hypothetical protein
MGPVPSHQNHWPLLCLFIARTAHGLTAVERACAHEEGDRKRFCEQMVAPANRARPAPLPRQAEARALQLAMILRARAGGSTDPGRVGAPTQDARSTLLQHARTRRGRTWQSTLESETESAQASGAASPSTGGPFIAQAWNGSGADCGPGTECVHVVRLCAQRFGRPAVRVRITLYRVSAAPTRARTPARKYRTCTCADECASTGTHHARIFAAAFAAASSAAVFRVRRGMPCACSTRAFGSRFIFVPHGMRAALHASRLGRRPTDASAQHDGRGVGAAQPARDGLRSAQKRAQLRRLVGRRR